MLSPELTVRFANIPNNALLELIEAENGSSTASASHVTICVQAEDGSRHTEDYDSSGQFQRKLRTELSVYSE